MLGSALPRTNSSGKTRPRTLFVALHKGPSLTLRRKHHSLQEFKRLAEQAKVNETQIIVKKLKSLRSSEDDKSKVRGDPTKVVEDLEAQLAVLKVRFTHSE